MRAPVDPYDGRDPLSVVLDSTPLIMIGVDHTGAVDYANDQAGRAFGCEPGALLGRSSRDLLPGVVAVDHAERRAAYLDDPRPVDVPGEHEARRLDGSTFLVEMVVTPVRRAADWWLVLGLRDVTARRVAQDRLAALTDLYRTLTSIHEGLVRTDDEQGLYDVLCRTTVAGGYLGAWVGRPDGAGRVVPVATAGALDDYVAGLDLHLDADHPRGGGPSARALLTGRPVYTDDFVDDPATAPWHAAAAPHGIRASATLPLCRDARPVAVLSLYATRPHVFDEAVRALLEQVAANASFVLDRLAADEALARLADERAVLARRLVDAQEDERARIAADVHDDSVQSMAALDLRLGLLQRRAEEEAPALLPPILELQAGVQQVGGRLRDLLFELEPADLTRAMPELVDDLAHHVFDEAPVTWRLRVDTDLLDVAPAPGTHLLPRVTCGQVLRILKEALINVRKHAAPAHVEVLVRPDAEVVTVTVTDDGPGIDDPVAAASRPGHRGLATMADRAQVVGGSVALEAVEPRGTRVVVRVPRSLERPPDRP